MSNGIKVCSFTKCERKVMAKGLCSGHYGQLWRGEEVRPLSRAAVTRGMSDRERFEVYVDRAGGCHVWTGSKNNRGYGQFRLDGKPQLAHRVAFEFGRGKIPTGLMIDHRCHERACVNLDHLRVVTNKQNAENRAGPLTGSRSGVLGVSWSTAREKWVGQVGHGGRRYNLGYFPTIQDAEAAVVARRLELFTHSDGR